uniref:CCHC-type domain-containing protein n=1 Tax=Nicotiana tabacum TaxID=4097 RepID=A0A1S4CAI4_TOBAC|nr:PREDICTED: uncharacterized protein LOC107816742 [Nicotiana tabacum]
MAEDSELWDIICDGPYFPTKAVGDLSLTMPKTRKEYTDADKKAVETHFRAKKILVCGMGPDEYNRISACEITKEIWKALQIAHEGTTQGDSSSEFEDETDAGDNSMMEVENEENEYDLIFSLMDQSDDEDEDNSEVNLKDVQRNLKSYSPKKLISLASVLIDAYHSLVEDKDALTLELGEAEQTRDDLLLTKTIKNFSKENEALVKRVTEIEEERDDLLIVIADLRETIEGLRTESKHGNIRKGKEVASEAYIRLENELEAAGTSLQGIGFQREKTPYNPNIKYVIISDNWLCTHCGNNGYFKENCQAMVQSIQKNKVFAENGTVKGSSQQWFMDSGCSKHMTENTILLSVSQICDKGNKVEFLSKICTVTNLVTGEVICGGNNHIAIKCFYIWDFFYQEPEDLPQTLATLNVNSQSGGNNAHYMDSGVSTHMTNNSGNLSNLKPYNGNDKIIVGNGQELDITHVGKGIISGLRMS